jgi:hypothetical protein
VTGVLNKFAKNLGLGPLAKEEKTVTLNQDYVRVGKEPFSGTMGTSTAPPQTLSPPNPRLDAMAAAFASIMLAPAHPPPMFASLASSPAPSRVILQVMFFIFYPFLSSKLAALLSAPHRGTSVPRIWCPPPSLLPTWNPCLCPQNRTLMRHAGALGLDTPEETDIFSHLSWLCLAR